MRRVAVPDSSGSAQPRRWRGRLLPGPDAVLVVALLLLLSAVIWRHLSDEQLLLDRGTPAAGAGGDAGARADSPTVGNGAGSGGEHGAATVETSSGAGAGPGTGQSGSGSAPTMVSGTAVSLVLIVGVNGAGLLVLRRLRRRAPRDGQPQPAPTPTPTPTPHSVPGRALDPVADLVPPLAPPSCPVTAQPVAAAAVGRSAVARAEPEATPRSEPEAARQPEDRPGHRTVPLGAPADHARGEAASGHGEPGPSRTVLFDRRLDKRVAFVVPGRLRWEGHDIAFTTVDLAMHGIGCQVERAEHPTLPDPAAQVQLALELDDTTVLLEARVAWRRARADPALLGLQFLSVPPAYEELLRTLVVTGTPV